jgi:hypothetical protein
MVLFVSMLVQAVMGLAGFFAPDLIRLVAAPGIASASLNIQYTDGFYMAGAIGALYALLQNNWIAARTYLAVEFIIIASFVVITVLNAFTPQGVQPLSWAYVLLSLLFLPTIVIAWRRELTRRDDGEVW